MVVSGGKRAPRGTVLLIDDEPLILHAYSRALMRTSLNVIPTGDSQEVPALLDRGGIDAVLCDLSMPGLDGLDVLALVRAHDVDLPVVLMTGGPTTAVPGVVGYLHKPVDIDVLRASAADAVGLRKLALASRAAHELVGGETLAEVSGPILSITTGTVATKLLIAGRVLDGLGRAALTVADLAELRPDVVRLHPALCRGIAGDARRREVIGWIAAACEMILADLVAPLAPSPDDEAALRAMGVDLMQRVA